MLDIFGKVRIRGRGKSEWILDVFNKVFIWDFNLSFYLGGRGSRLIYLRLKKETVIKIITKTKLLGQ